MTRKEVVELLINEGILVAKGTEYILIPEFKPKTSKIAQDYPKLLQDYADLWPKGVKSGGRLIRKTTASLDTKLKAFINRRKDIPYQAILDGTEAYLNSQKAKGWEYTISSDYFILKNGSSELESYAELAMSGDLPNSESKNFVTGLN